MEVIPKGEIRDLGQFALDADSGTYSAEYPFLHGNAVIQLHCSPGESPESAQERLQSTLGWMQFEASTVIGKLLDKLVRVKNEDWLSEGESPADWGRLMRVIEHERWEAFPDNRMAVRLNLGGLFQGRKLEVRASAEHVFESMALVLADGSDPIELGSLEDPSAASTRVQIGVDPIIEPGKIGELSQYYRNPFGNEWHGIYEMGTHNIDIWLHGKPGEPEASTQQRLEKTIVRVFEYQHQILAEAITDLVPMKNEAWLKPGEAPATEFSMLGKLRHHKWVAFADDTIRIELAVVPELFWGHGVEVGISAGFEVEYVTLVG